MKKTLVLFTILVMAAGACPASDVEDLAADNTRFALKLYKDLNDGSGNLFFSPYSISTAMAMTWGGARGETASQMAGALEFTLKPDKEGGPLGRERLHIAFGELQRSLRAAGGKGGVEMSIANALWPQKDYPFLKSYLEMIEAEYGSASRPLDYRSPEEARGVINRWVEGETRRKIKDLLPEGSIDSMTRMVLTNAIYFKGNWATQFNVKRTREMPFRLAAGKSRKTPMMFQKGNFGYFQDDEVQVLEMPYKGEKVAMVVLLPRKVDGLAALEKHLAAEKLSGWLGKLRRVKVDTLFPRFKLTSRFDLSGKLQNLGMKKAFSDADFSRMDGTTKLYLSAVFHKAFVEVNEEGTEAAAATGAVVGLRSIRRGPSFRADHPFLFLIRDKATGSILFLGRYVSPAS
ncbi:MAG: proteinase inhibitor I4 serpin [Planctomycetes bacterium]|nr:proteinase inhibitor I4 serpin [Planctomycetota bacterium]